MLITLATYKVILLCTMCLSLPLAIFQYNAHHELTCFEAMFQHLILMVFHSFVKMAEKGSNTKGVKMATFYG